MATGIVLSIDPSGTTGQVQVDETGETVAFNDTNFPNTGLTATAPNNSCTFDIDLIPQSGRGSVPQYYATNLAVAAPPRNQSITSAITQDITALVGDIITISTATAIITGNVTINGGKVIVDQGAQINGNITVNSDGMFVARNKGKVMGSIGINSGGSLKVVNKGKIVGNIGVSQGGRMIIGNENGGGCVTGAISIGSIRNVSITADSTINCPGS